MNVFDWNLKYFDLIMFFNNRGGQNIKNLLKQILCQKGRGSHEPQELVTKPLSKNLERNWY